MSNAPIDIKANPQEIFELKEYDIVSFDNIFFKVEYGGYTSNTIYFTECTIQGIELNAPENSELMNECYAWRHIRFHDPEDSMVNTALATRKEFYNWITNNQVKVW